MRVFTVDDIRSWEPCYDPTKVISPDWTGTVVDMLDQDHMSLHDRLWTVLRPECLSIDTMKAFVRQFGSGVDPDKVGDLRSAARHAASRHRTNAGQKALKYRSLWDRLTLSKPKPGSLIARGTKAVEDADLQQIAYLKALIVKEHT